MGVRGEANSTAVEVEGGEEAGVGVVVVRVREKGGRWDVGWLVRGRSWEVDAGIEVLGRWASALARWRQRWQIIVRWASCLELSRVKGLELYVGCLVSIVAAGSLVGSYDLQYSQDNRNDPAGSLETESSYQVSCTDFMGIWAAKAPMNAINARGVNHPIISMTLPNMFPSSIPSVDISHAYNHAKTSHHHQRVIAKPKTSAVSSTCSHPDRSRSATPSQSSQPPTNLLPTNCSIRLANKSCLSPTDLLPHRVAGRKADGAEEHHHPGADDPCHQRWADHLVKSTRLA